MHYLLGLAALVIGAIIASRRTRPTWFIVTTCVLVVIGALLAILSYTRVTDPLGLVANNILGWVFVGFALMTMLSAGFVLERRGARGEELPPLIGDNPLDGDTDDSDDPVHGRGSGSAADAVLGGAASVGAAGAVSSGSPRYAGVGAAGTEAFAAEAAGEPVYDTAPPAETDADYDAWVAAGEPGPDARAAESRPDRADAGEPGSDARADADRRDPDVEAASGAPGADGQAATSGAPGTPAGDAAMESALRASLGAGGGDPGAHTDERPAERAADPPVASDGAEDGTTVIGADPDLATPPAETDVEAAPEGTDDGETDDHLGTPRH